MTRALKLALIGAGKIARDQHVPALARNSAFELVAAASPHGQLAGVQNYPDIETLLTAVPDIDAVAICTPPQVRGQVARHALNHGCHVLLEKPPACTLNEVGELIELAQRRQLALYATWHSREASGVEPARQWLAQRQIRRVDVQWKEDVRVWHPGQSWIWKAGGLGVFDPGINALSILTRILPKALVLQDAALTFPANWETPIAAKLNLRYAGDSDVSVELDFCHAGAAKWDIDVSTDDGHLRLSKGGAELSIDGVSTLSGANMEYTNLYSRFAQLIVDRRLDVDLAPFNLVADAFLCGRRIECPAFLD